MKKVTIRFEDDVWKAIRHKAIDIDKPTAAVIDAACRAYLGVMNK